MLTGILAFDAALVVALHASAHTNATAVVDDVPILTAIIGGAILLALTNCSTRAALIANRIWPTKLYCLNWRKKRRLRFRTHLLVSLTVFYRDALLRALRGELALRILAALVACTIAVLLSRLHASDSWALVFWFSGATLSANALASLATPLGEMHAASRQYFGALPLGMTSAKLGDAATLCVLTIIVTATFATVGSFIVPGHVCGWFAGVGAALIVAMGQLAIGAGLPRQVVVLTFLLDVAVVAAFGWLLS